MSILDEFNFHSGLAFSAGPALVLFSSPDCGACRSIERHLPNWIDPEIALFYVDVQQSTALARQYEVFHLPTLFLFKDGQYHAKVECEMNAEALRRAIALALAQPPEEEP